MRKRNMRYAGILIATVLAGGLLCTACGSGSGGQLVSALDEQTQEVQEEAALDISKMSSKPAPEKEETVHVSADASGVPQEITVEATLKKTEGSELISDRSDLQEIINKRGDERNAFGDETERVGKEQTVYWENAGTDITYEGTSDHTLPVQVGISYYLDDKKLTPDQIAGKSGKVRIRIDYKNQETQNVSVDGENISVNVPFAVISMMTLSKDHFSNVEIENGKMMTIGEQDMVVGYAFPGLKSSLKLKDMEETADIEVPDYVEVTADVTDFSLDYSAHIVTNGMLSDADLTDLDDAKDLSDGMNKLMDASGELVDGMQTLTDGSNTFGDYLTQYTNGATELKDGAKALSDGAEQMDQSMQQAAKELDAALDEWESALAQIEAAMEQYQGNDMMQQIGAQAGDLKNVLETAGAKLSGIDWEAVDAGALEAKATEQAVAAASAAVDELSDEQLSAEDKQTLKEEISSEITSAVDLSDALTEAIPENAKANVEEALASLNAASDELAAMQTALGAAETAEAGSGDVSPLSGISNLDTEELRSMIDQFSTGMHQLSEGAQALEEGSAQMADASNELNDGYAELANGMSALYDGMKAFDEEGISKLSDLAGDDLADMIRRVQALQDVDQAYTNFSGIADETKGTVRFVIETEAI